MKIAMLTRNPKLYSHQRLKQAAEARGHELDMINTLRCSMNIASRRPEIYYEGAKLPRYDAVIPRIGASITFYGLAVLRQFEMQGVYPLNESVAIGRSRDKLRSMQLLARDGIGLPVTTFAHDPKKAEEVIKLSDMPALPKKIRAERFHRVIAMGQFAGFLILPVQFRQLTAQTRLGIKHRFHLGMFAQVHRFGHAGHLVEHFLFHHTIPFAR